MALGVSLTTYMIVQIFAAGSLPTGPIYNLIAILSTMGGILIVKQLIKGRAELKPVSLAVLLITAGSVSRTVTMTFVNALSLPQPFPIGFSIPSE